MKNIIVTLGGFGDFDMPTIDSTWLAPEGMDKKDVSIIVKEIKHSNSNNPYTKKAAKQLKDLGFTACNTVECLVGGNL